MLLMVVLAVTTKAISHPTSSSSEADDESFSSRLGKAAEQDSLPSRQVNTKVTLASLTFHSNFFTLVFL